ncbi:hypothetical protein LOK49_LG08G03360 [Camellia lanceoleosa]|uniref:Uncharacterized protein n=1 Tax=Camellia lanceoleosa TaxID=1840588 RepID=A0ACC0GWS9_9ERIC|nr:hypothetical protein LOK49_LG08G03360 [Camellia lanceoleosa]
MDHMPPRDGDFAVDLESGGQVTETFVTKVCGVYVSIDELIRGEKGVSLSGCVPNCNGVPMENVKLLVDKKVEGDEVEDLVENNKSGKERRKTTSAKKPPRPPRPPKALSLDTADQKLIKEISELATMKCARIERMKALKKTKAAKASTSTCNFFAMLFTIIFCLVMLFQGMSPGRSSTVSFQGSSESAQLGDSGFVSVHYHRNTSASDSSIPGSASPSLVEQISSLDHGYNV